MHMPQGRCVNFSPDWTRSRRDPLAIPDALPNCCVAFSFRYNEGSYCEALIWPPVSS